MKNIVEKMHVDVKGLKSFGLGDIFTVDTNIGETPGITCIDLVHLHALNILDISACKIKNDAGGMGQNNNNHSPG